MTNEKPQKLNKMGTQPIPKLIFSMSWPAILSMTIAALYNMVDSIYVSRISNDALTAISYVMPIQLLMISVGVGTGVGINSLIARRLGAKRFDEANKAASSSIPISVWSWLIFVLIGVFVAKAFVQAYTKDPVISTYGIDYLRIVTIFSYCGLTEIIFEKIIQATGNMIAPMIISMTGAITNIILDPVLIFGLLGAPRLEVKGAAIATVIGQAVSFAVAVYIFKTRDHEVKIDIRDWKPDPETIKNIYAVGLPTIVMQSIGSVMLIGYNWILSASKAAVAVLGVYFKIESFVFMPAFGLQQGALPMIGYNFGARNKERMIETYKMDVIISLAIMTVGTIVFNTIPGVFMGMFNANDEMMEIGVPALRIISLCFIPAAIGVSTETVFQALGHGLYSLIASFVRQLIGILPIAYALYNLYGISVSWYSFPIAELLGLAYALMMLVIIYNREIKTL